MKKRKITFITIVCTSSWDFSYFSREAFKSSWRRRAFSSWIDPWKMKSTYTAVNWNLKPHLHSVASFSSTSSYITREAFKLWTLGGFVHTTLKEFLNRRFHFENTSNVFRPHYAGEIQTRNNDRSVWFVFEENSGREITCLSWRHRFRKATFSKCFPSTPKRKAGAFSNSSGLNSVFEKSSVFLTD